MMYIDAADTAAAAAVAVVFRRWICFVREVEVAGCGYRSGARFSKNLRKNPKYSVSFS